MVEQPKYKEHLKYQYIAVFSGILTIITLSKFIYNINFIWIIGIITSYILFIVYGLLNDGISEIYILLSILLLVLLYIIYIKLYYEIDHEIEDDLKRKHIL